MFDSFFIVLFCIFNTLASVSATDYIEDFSRGSFNSSKYDKDFQSTYSKGQVNSLINYLDKLSEYVPTDSNEERKEKTKAILYFFATGGERGFRETPATPKEIEKLTHILKVTTALGYEGNENEFDLLQVRQKYGRPSYDQTSDEDIKAHLLIAQSIISSVVIAKPFIENYGKLNTDYENAQLQVKESFKHLTNVGVASCNEDTKNNFYKLVKLNLIPDTIKIVIDCMKRDQAYRLPYAYKEIQIDLLKEWIEEFFEEFKEIKPALETTKFTAKPRVSVSAPHIQSSPLAPLKKLDDKKSYDELEKLLSEFNQANNMLSEYEAIYQMKEKEALRQMIELKNKDHEAAKKWIKDYGEHYKVKYPDLFEKPSQIPEIHTSSRAPQPNRLEFEAVSVKFSYDVARHAHLPYFTYFEGSSGREAFRGKLDGKDITLLNYQTIGGGKCGFAALFQALSPIQGNTEFVSEYDGEHPLYDFIRNLGQHLHIPAENMLYQHAEVGPFLNSGTFQQLEKPLGVRAYIWLKEKNGIILNCSPRNTDINAKSIHILLSNNHGKADGHFSLLVPSDDRLLIERAKSHEQFAQNAEREYEKAQTGKFF